MFDVLRCRIFLSLSIFLLTFTRPSSLYARTWHVPSEIVTIKQALEDSSSYGDTVLVATGIYNTASGEVFPLNMKNGVVLISEKGRDSTVIDVGSTERGFICVGLDANTMIRGFTVQNASHGSLSGGCMYCANSNLSIIGNKLKDATIGGSGRGGGIYCLHANPAIDSNVITGNTANSGGICCDSSSPTITKNTIQGNTVTNFGAGIYCLNASSPMISGNIIENNSGHYGSGITCDGASAATISGNIIQGNTASAYGGGIYCSNSNPVIEDNVINGNNTVNSAGGGIHCYYSSPVITGDTIRENAGWGIYCQSSTPTITGNILKGNRTDSRGIICYISSSPTISGNTIEDMDHEAIHCQAFGSPTISNNVMRKNGSGVWCTSISSPTIENNTISENDIGIYCESSSSPTVRNNIIQRNDLGIQCWDDYSSPNIMHNTIIGNGGCLWSEGSLTSPALFANAIIDNGGGISIAGSSDTVNGHYNNIYYNSYQPGGYELINGTAITIDWRNNFWWTTDTTEIDSFISGPCTFKPFLTAPSDSAPGEPSTITSVTVMSDSTYTTALTDTLDVGDIIYIQVTGNDLRNSYTDLAVVILTTNKDNYGIAVALLESITSPGVYQGTAYCAESSNDAMDIIGVNPADRIIVKANVDSTVQDTVIVVNLGITEEPQTTEYKTDIAQLTVVPNPFRETAVIRCSLNDLTVSDLRLAIYDESGRLIESFQPEVPRHRVDSQLQMIIGRGLKAGVYFIRVNDHKPVKVVKLR